MEKGFCLKLSVLSGSAGSVSETVAEFLSSRLVDRDVKQLPGSFQQGRVTVDGYAVLPSDSLVVGQQVSLYLPSHQEAAVDTNWRTIWQNDELMLVYKPALLPVSRTTRNLYQTLISLIRRETAFPDARLLHRMDTETSGVMLIAKDLIADRKWKKLFQQLVRRKVYHTWVDGNPDWEQTTLVCELSEKVDSAIRSQMYVIDPNSSLDYIRSHYPKPQFSKSAFKVLKRATNRTLVECELFTGRKHQIRAHLAYLGHPVIGDKIYSHGGYFYLKRLTQPLTQDDMAVLGAEHHLLESVLLELDGRLLESGLELI